MGAQSFGCKGHVWRGREARRQRKEGNVVARLYAFKDSLQCLRTIASPKLANFARGASRPLCRRDDDLSNAPKVSEFRNSYVAGFLRTLA